MKKMTHIPDKDGLYWYFENDKDPTPILIDIDRYGIFQFKGCADGRLQSWITNGEYFIGPIDPPDTLLQFVLETEEK